MILKASGSLLFSKDDALIGMIFVGSDKRTEIYSLSTIFGFVDNYKINH